MAPVCSVLLGFGFDGAASLSRYSSTAASDLGTVRSAPVRSVVAAIVAQQHVIDRDNNGEMHHMKPAAHAAAICAVLARI